MNTIHRKKTLNLACFVSLFFIDQLQKYLLQEENVVVLIRRFPCSLMCGDCMPQFHVRVCEAIISICNRWELEEFKMTCKLVFNRF